MSVLLLFGAVQGGFLSLVLFRMRTGNNIANQFLAWLLLVFSLGLVEGFLSVTYLYLKIPYLIGLQWPMLFLYGPLVYFYVKSLTVPGWRMQYGKAAVHFLPAGIMYMYLIPFFLMNPEAKARLWFFENGQMRNSLPVVDPIASVAIIQIAGYLVLSLALLKAHSRNIRDNFSSIESINLQWLKTLVIILFCLLGAYAFFQIISQFYGLYKQSEYLLNLMEAVLIYVMAYKGMRQPEIFTTSAIPPAPAPMVSQDIYAERPDTAPDKRQPEAENGQAEKYRKSALTDEQSEKILARLTHLMEKEKPYFEMELTLPMLSNMLNVSPNHLSQVINGKLNKSFFDFVNAYRVEETKKSLISPESDRFSILGIAMDAGFNSKSAFYSAFKKQTGMTPSQFKQHRQPSDLPPAQS